MTTSLCLTKEVSKSKKYIVPKIYIAAPFFNKEQIELVTKLKGLLEAMEFEVFSPYHHGYVLKPNDSVEKRREVYEDNLFEISLSDYVLCVTNWLCDAGTFIDTGIGIGRGKKIIYFCSTLDSIEKFNVMLAQSAFAIATSYFELSEILERIKKGETDFEKFRYKGKVM
jgi:nucleoside 2-deoxyribosyltransferase